MKTNTYITLNNYHMNMKSHARHKHGTRLSGYGETIQVFIPPTCDVLFIHLDFLVERILFI